MTRTPDLTGKRAVVTGATSGIGRPIAAALARAGAEVFVVGRNPELTRRTVTEIGGAARAEICDFASLHAVAELARRIGDRPLDILVNNAGAMNLRREVSRDGYELTLAVNHLAPFLLTTRLLPALTAAPAARVVTTASSAQDMGRVRMDDLMMTHGYGAMRAYSQSKLANVMFTAELARHLIGTMAVANCFHPGVVGTSFGAKGGMMGAFWSVARRFLLTPEQGADTGIWLATSPEVAGISGQFYARHHTRNQNAQAVDPAQCAALWQRSGRLVDAALAK